MYMYVTFHYAFKGIVATMISLIEDLQLSTIVIYFYLLKHRCLSPLQQTAFWNTKKRLVWLTQEHKDVKAVLWIRFGANYICYSRIIKPTENVSA